MGTANLAGDEVAALAPIALRHDHLPTWFSSTPTTFTFWMHWADSWVPPLGDGDAPPTSWPRLAWFPSQPAKDPKRQETTTQEFPGRTLRES